MFSSALGARDDLLWYEAGLAKVFELKLTGRIGEAPDCGKEVRVLNRVVKIDTSGLTFDADPRHV